MRKLRASAFSGGQDTEEAASLPPVLSDYPFIHEDLQNFQSDEFYSLKERSGKEAE